MEVRVVIDDALLARAESLTGIKKPEHLVAAALNALIERESARLLRRLGGTQSDLVDIPRRRSVIYVIRPYWYLDMWVFDDPLVGLTAEPFVGGADTMIDRVTSHIPDAKGGFNLVFSASRFPEQQFRLEWKREEGTGNVYYSEDLGTEAWLCPALLRYFDSTPSELYVQVKQRQP